MNKIKLPNTIKRFIVGVWLFVLYIFCITTVVFSLSACLFQEKLESLSKMIDDDKSTFTKYYCNQNSVASINSSNSANAMVEAQCVPAPSTANRKNFTSSEILIRYNIWKGLNNEAINAFVNEAQSTIDLKKIDFELAKKQDVQAIRNLKMERDLVLGNLEKSNEVKSFLQELTKKNQTEGQLGEIFVQIDHFENFFQPIAKILALFMNVQNYWSFPEPLLKINLVLTMGILGSLIFVTIEFIKEPKEHFRQSFIMYFFRPFLGMIIALSMYVMVKSGQSILFSSIQNELSPYLISFLGIVSGMLSEQAYRRIETTGIQMLSANDETKGGADTKEPKEDP